jgi:putative effector of murein hydrolase
LIWLTTTIIGYLIADGVARLGNHLGYPVLLSVLLIAPVARLTRTNYATYFEIAQFIHFLLGPRRWLWPLMPLWDNRDADLDRFRSCCWLCCGSSIVAAGSTILLARAFGHHGHLLSLAQSPRPRV